MRTPFHSIRWHVQLWHGLILLVVVVAFCLATYRLAWNNLERRIDANLTGTERLLMGGLFSATVSSTVTELRSPDSSRPAQPLPPPLVAQRLREGTLILPDHVRQRFSGDEEGFAYHLFADRDGRVILRSPNAPADTTVGSAGGRDFVDDFLTVGSRREHVRSLGPDILVTVGVDITPELAEIHRFRLSIAAAGAGVWLLGLLGGWWIAGRAIKPIATISQTATRIAGGNLTERISTEGTENELDQLSRVLNDTFDRLHAAFERQRQFTADASHELRTPISILLSESHRILKRERSPEEYRHFVVTSREAAGRMRRLIDALLLLARQENAGVLSPSQAATCDLPQLVQASAAEWREPAAQRGLQLHLDLRPATCPGDPASLSILLNNLIGNAVQHHHGGGNVWVDTHADALHAFVTVRDDGPGIAVGDLPHIFDRFYRADKSRSAQSGHSGLGLAIVKTIADNHHARVAVQSLPGEGATFTLAVPR